MRRLAVRIETLQRTRTHDWNPADELEFKGHLPGGRGRQVLPDPAWLRARADEGAGASDEDVETLALNWRHWVVWTLRCEDLVRDNDPRNPRKMMRDMARGKFPGMF